MIRHKETSWKCQFCPELFESENTIQLHLETVHSMNREEIEMSGILKSARVFPIGKTQSSCGSAGGGGTSSDVSGEDGADEEESDEDDEDVSTDYKSIVVKMFHCFYFLG